MISIIRKPFCILLYIRKVVKNIISDAQSENILIVMIFLNKRKRLSGLMVPERESGMVKKAWEQAARARN